MPSTAPRLLGSPAETVSSQEAPAKSYIRGKTVYVGAYTFPYQLYFKNEHPTRLIVVQVDQRKPGTLVPDWRTYRIHPGTSQSIRYQRWPQVPRFRAFYD